MDRPKRFTRATFYHAWFKYHQRLAFDEMTRISSEDGTYFRVTGFIRTR